MDKSNVLLSQDEIDALLNFLTEKKVSSSIMDQDSIDKLINFLQSGESAGFRLDEIVEQAESSGSSLIILPGNENVNDPYCSFLTVRTNDRGCIELVCTAAGNEYIISPDSVQRVKYLDPSKSFWGRSIAPNFFDHAAKLLNARYTKATYLDVCSRFAEVNFPSSVSISSIYLPTEEALMQRMTDK